MVTAQPWLAVVALLLLSVVSHAIVLNFEDLGGIPSDESNETCAFNSELLANVLNHNASNHTLLFPYNTTFHFHHGIIGANVTNSVIQIDGTIRFEKAELDIDGEHHPFPSNLMFDHGRNITITSSSRGLIDGRGPQWWGVPVVGYIQHLENRPRLLRFNFTEDLLIENIILQDSPYHTLYLDTVNRVEVRNISIVARRTHRDGHYWIDLTAFNTDGIDVSGHNVHIHDIDIWVQDDCIALKDSAKWASSNMTFERINATGVGFTVGSILASHVHNITFRDSYMHKPVKGLYMKFANPSKFIRKHNLTSLVENILYQNITIEAPSQWPIWVGPAQQSDSRKPCHPNPCSLCWPMSPTAHCHVVKESKFRSITLKDIVINNPSYSTGVIMGSEMFPIENLHWDNVRVTKGKPDPRAGYPLNETFPGLLQPIHDPYVPQFLDARPPRYETEHDEWPHIDDEIFYPIALRVPMQKIQSAVMLLLVALLAYWETRGADDKAMVVRRRWATALVVLFGIVLVFSDPDVHLQVPHWHKPEWKRTDRYYVCEGVLNSTYRGKTWPHPPCFSRHPHDVVDEEEV